MNVGRGCHGPGHENILRDMAIGSVMLAVYVVYRFGAWLLGFEETFLP